MVFCGFKYFSILWCCHAVLYGTKIFFYLEELSGHSGVTNFLVSSPLLHPILEGEGEKCVVMAVYSRRFC